MKNQSGSAAQQLVADIARNMLARPDDDIAAAACGALEELARTARVERAYIFLLNETGDAIQDIHEWYHDSVAPHDYDAMRGVSTDAFPWSMQQWLRGETIRVSDPDALPEEAAPERGACEALMIGSYINLPLFESGRLVGWLGYDSVHKHRDWSDAEPLISIAGDIIAAALMRKHRDNILLRERELEARAVSMGTLAAGLAHEINNPLTYTVGNLELIEQALQAPEGARANGQKSQLLENVRDALDGAHRVALIVDDLKSLARGDDADGGVVNVTDVLTASLRMASNCLRHKAVVVRELAPDLPPAACTNTKLGQVILNLLLNAAEAIPDGQAADNRIRVAATADADNVTITIQDTGKGIPQEYQSRIFDPFFTGRPGVGMGMGLAVCKHIVHEFGGTLRISSEPGAGTTVIVSLPRAEREATDRPPPIRTDRIRDGRLRVLIIDDDMPVLQLLGRHLAAHESVLLGSGREAIELLRKDSDFDVLVCDVQLGDCTGMQVHAEVEKVDPRLSERMVFITGGAFTPASESFLDQPGRHVITKPFRGPDLCRAVTVAAVE